MECRFCKREMEKGYIQSGKMIVWAPKRAKVFLPVLKSDTVILAESYFTFASVESYCCENCKRIIVEYDADP